MTPARRSRLAKLAQLLTIVVFSAMLLELLVRIGLNQTIKPIGFFPVGLIQYEQDVGSRNRPGRYTIRNTEFETHLSINAQGFRSETDYGPASERPIVAFLGDSITEAIQVPEADTFVKQVATMVPAECRNYGVLSHGTANALAIYRHDVRATQPRLVVLTMFANDPRNCSPVLENSLSSWRPAYRFDAAGRPEALLEFGLPADESYHFGGLRRSRVGRAAWEFLRECQARSEALKLVRRFLKRRDAATPTADTTWSIYEDPWPPEMAEAVSLMDWCFDRLATEVAEDGARLIVCYVPAVQEVVDEAWDEMVAQLSTTETGAFDPRRLELHLKELAKVAGVPFVDCRDTFVAADRAGEVLHFPHDRHLTPAGHKLVATELAPVVHEALETP